LSEYRFAILTVSDTRTLDTDASGDAIEDQLRDMGATDVERQLVPDERSQISAAIIALSEGHDMVVTTGGTGFAPRDVTPEATLDTLDRVAEGIAQLLRQRGAQSTAFAWLSRGVAGTRGRTLVVNLPGSPTGALQGIQALAPILPHLLDQLRGGGQHDAL